MAICLDGRALDVSGMTDSNEHVGVSNEVFQLDLVHLIDDLGAAIVAVRFMDFLQLGDDDGFQFLVAVENFPQLANEFSDGFQLLENFINRKLGEAVQLQFEDGVDLRVTEAGVGRQAVFFAVENDAVKFFVRAVLDDCDGVVGEIFKKIFFGIGAAGRPTNDTDHVVEVIERDLIAEQNVFALFGFFQFENGATANNVYAVLDK